MHRLTGAEDNIHYGAYTIEGALPVARRLLRRKRRPTALVCASDDMAAAVLHAAQELGCDADFELWNPEYGWWLDKRKNNLADLVRK